MDRLKQLLSEQLSHDASRVDLLAILKLVEIVEELERRVIALEND